MERVLRREEEKKVCVPELIPDRPWQENLLRYLALPAHPRKVVWYVDLVGNSGKSHFARHYHEKSSMIVTGGKHSDIYYAYNYEKVVFFDFARSREDAVPWEVIENFKNGFFLSTKYEVRRMVFNPPHVVCFANFHPDLAKLSADRWDIINIF